VLVLDPAAADLEPAAAALLGLLDRARVWPAARPAAATPSPLHVVRPVLVCASKRDLDPGDTLAALAHEAVGAELPLRSVSAERGDGIEELRPLLFELLGRVRIYAKEPGRKPDLERPFVLPRGATVLDLANAVHKEFAARLRFARLWGHARFDGQQVERDHVLFDRDVVELHG
jgi:hypothetical protein